MVGVVMSWIRLFCSYRIEWDLDLGAIFDGYVREILETMVVVGCGMKSVNCLADDKSCIAFNHNFDVRSYECKVDTFATRHFPFW
jgi:hypothetical protein